MKDDMISAKELPALERKLKILTDYREELLILVRRYEKKITMDHLLPMTLESLIKMSISVAPSVQDIKDLVMETLKISLEKED